MRTEYTIVTTDSKNKKQYTTYAKSVVMDHYLKTKNFYEPKGCTVELFKVQYNGVSFYKAEKIEAV